MNATTSASLAASRPNSWRVVVAASIGNALEWFDLVVYGFFAVVIAKLFFPTGNDTVSLLLTLGTFGVSFFMRPLGAILIGAYADRAGRVRARRERPSRCRTRRPRKSPASGAPPRGSAAPRGRRSGTWEGWR